MHYLCVWHGQGLQQIDLWEAILHKDNAIVCVYNQAKQTTKGQDVMEGRGWLSISCFCSRKENENRKPRMSCNGSSRQWPSTSTWRGAHRGGSEGQYPAHLKKFQQDLTVKEKCHKCCVITELLVINTIPWVITELLVINHVPWVIAKLMLINEGVGQPTRSMHHIQEFKSSERLFRCYNELTINYQNQF